MESKTKKSYQSPQLTVFGTVTELTLEACRAPGADGKTCNANSPAGGQQGSSTPGQGFP